jgi:peptidoglycan hydrolase-like protein with peptidoglycan-binding domain
MPDVKKLVEHFTSLTQGVALKPGQYKITAKTWDVRACVCIPGVTFAFDKSFIRPSVVDALKSLQEAFDAHHDAMVFVFGHTDKVGSEQYNKDLSDRRAKSAYAFVTNDVALWEGLYNEESWGLASVQEILADLGFYKGPTDGKDTPASKQAIKDYQISKGQADTGTNDKALRELLFTDYMTGKHDVKIAKERFLEPKFTGCGEFNPKIDTEKEEEKNRRVSFFLFDPGKVPKIPCKVGDMAPCKKMIALPGPRKKKEFKCAFFDNVSSDCACESAPPKPPTYTVSGTVVFYNKTWDYNTAPQLPKTQSLPPEKQALPGAALELYLESKLSKGTFVLHSHGHLSDDGAFSFPNIEEVTKAKLRIVLEYKDGKIAVVKGKSTLPAEPDFEVKTGQTVWHEVPLDSSKWDGKTLVVDTGETEIKHALFRDICDAYKTVWFGHGKMLEMTGVDLPLCRINYPDAVISNASVTMQLLKDDLKDRDVILHEYGHFIQQHILGGVSNAGYGYNDDLTGSHGRTSLEHYESAWCEGYGTFMSCALCDDPHYHDGYDAFLDFHLDKDNTLLGPHCEGSIQEMLWNLHKTGGVAFKDGIWKALSRPGHQPQTVFEFFNNWKELGLAGLDKVVASFKKFKMEFGYEYKLRFKCVGAPGAFDAAKKEFRTLQELFENFGAMGSGTIAQYKEEFYNRNKEFNAGTLAGGSTIADPKVTAGKEYIIPVRFQVKE